MYMTVPEGILRAIIQAAIQAPSGDNLQPWRFEYDGEKLFLFQDSARDTSLYNVRQLASYIASGASLENIQLAASAHGYERHGRGHPGQLHGEQSDHHFWLHGQCIVDVHRRGLAPARLGRPGADSVKWRA